MFPISADSNNKNSLNVLLNSILILGCMLLVSLTVIYFFPDILIRIFSGKYIPEASSILIYPAIAISIVSLSNLIILYKLSLGNTKNYQLLLIFVAVEIALLSYFNDNLVEFSVAFMTSSAIFFWGAIFLLDKN